MVEEDDQRSITANFANFARLNQKLVLLVGLESNPTIANFGAKLVRTLPN